MSTLCPTCAVQPPPGATFCDNCGEPLSSAPSAPVDLAAVQTVGQATCPQCAEPVLAGEAFCGNCGASLEQAVPQAPVVQPPPVTMSPPFPVEQPVQAGNSCPSCGAATAPGSAFCDSCGASISVGVQQQEALAQVVTIIPHLIIQPMNATIQFPAGQSEVIIGRQDPVSGHFPEIDLSSYGAEEAGVSRSHAKIVLQGGQCFIEDLNAVNFTFVNRKKISPNVRQPLNHEDELRFGKVVAVFYLQ